TPNRANKLNVGYARTLEELASRSDIFTIHLPLKPQTRGAINRAVLEALPEGAMVINTARSEVLDYGALEELIPKKALRVGLNIEEISNTVFEGAHATCSKVRVTGRPSEACLQEIAAFDEVLHVDVVALPNLA